MALAAHAAADETFAGLPFAGPAFVPDGPLFFGVRPDSFVEPNPATFVFAEKANPVPVAAAVAPLAPVPVPAVPVVVPAPLPAPAVVAVAPGVDFIQFCYGRIVSGQMFFLE
jgi:hypothetical protein